MRAWVATLRELPADRGPARVVYISTTGVYGDCQGAWVNEDTPARPDAARSRRRLDAENTLRVYGRERGVPVSILRVPGIYGPGRLPVDAIHARRPVLDEKECGYTNRIHAEDLAHVCLIAGQRGQADRVYNVSDGQPDSITHYYNCVADALGVPRPR
jgi:nucleoside-diphosphate-sugar epimerase